MAALRTFEDEDDELQQNLELREELSYRVPVSPDAREQLERYKTRVDRAIELLRREQR
jgi:hypothetical protein